MEYIASEGAMPLAKTGWCDNIEYEKRSLIP